MGITCKVYIYIKEVSSLSIAYHSLHIPSTSDDSGIVDKKILNRHRYMKFVGPVTVAWTLPVCSCRLCPSDNRLA